LPSRRRLLRGRATVRPAAVMPGDELMTMVDLAVAIASPSGRMPRPVVGLRSRNSTVGSTQVRVIAPRGTLSFSHCTITFGCGAIDFASGADIEIVRLRRPRRVPDHIDHRVGSSLHVVRCECSGRPIISSCRTIVQSSCTIISSCGRVISSVGAMPPSTRPII
jgi:hypothetical protein